MSYYHTPLHPLREALKAVVGKDPPAFVTGHDVTHLTDRQVMELQDWCGLNARPEWATGLSMLEAAELIVAGAVENGNIASAEEVAKDPPPDLERCQAEVPKIRSERRVRCDSKPQVIVEETGPDAVKGRKSLCGPCQVIFKQIHGVRGYRFTPIKKARKKRESSSRGTRMDGSTRHG